MYVSFHLIAFWGEIHIINIHISVTVRGLHYLDLGCTAFGYNPNNSSAILMAKGNFSGLDTLGRDSDYPLVITTQKKKTCAFLELRGDEIEETNYISLIFFYIDVSAKCRVIRKIPISCLCSTVLTHSRISKVKVDSSLKVG